jgi:hypothetical protein
VAWLTGDVYYFGGEAALGAIVVLGQLVKVPPQALERARGKEHAVFLRRDFLVLASLVPDTTRFLISISQAKKGAADTHCELA